MDRANLRSQFVWAAVAVPMALSVATSSHALYLLGSLTATAILLLLWVLLVCCLLAAWFVPSMPVGPDRDKLLDLLAVFVKPRRQPFGPGVALAQSVLLPLICWLAGANAIAVLLVLALLVSRWLQKRSRFVLSLYTRSAPKEA